jgi:hypothetical protein
VIFTSLLFLLRPERIIYRSFGVAGSHIECRVLSAGTTLDESTQKTSIVLLLSLRRLDRTGGTIPFYGIVRQLRLSSAVRRGFYMDISDCHHDAFRTIGRAKHIHMDGLILAKMTITHARHLIHPPSLSPQRQNSPCPHHRGHIPRLITK